MKAKRVNHEDVQLRCAAVIPEVRKVAEGFSLTPNQCPERLKPGHFMCDPHWAKVDIHLKRMILEKQAANRKAGLRRYNAEWRLLAKEAVEDVFRKLWAENKAAAHRAALEAEAPEDVTSAPATSSAEPSTPPQGQGESTGPV